MAEQINDEQTRIAKLEVSAEQLHGDISVLFKEVRRTQGEVRDAIKELTERLSQSGRTNWGTVAAWAAVFLTVVALAGTLINNQFASLAREGGRMERELTELRADRLKEAYERGRIFERVAQQDREK